MFRNSLAPRTRFSSVAWLGTVALLWSAGVGWAANERALWDLWNTHTANPDKHLETITACRDYLKTNSRDALAPVARQLAAWHLLKIGKTVNAAELLEPYVDRTDTPLNRGASSVAQAWLSRVDREAVKAALQGYYRKEVKYPASLDQVGKHPEVSKAYPYRPKDRWGISWKYTQTGLKGFPGLEGQGYTLSSRNLSSSSDLAEALTLPYAGQCPLKPSRVLATGGRTVVQFKSESGKGQAIDEGGRDAGIYVAYAGKALVIVCDDNHWIVFRKP